MVLTQQSRSSAQTWVDEPRHGATLAERLEWYASVALWAPSKHNTQPWRFVVRDGAALELHSDASRALPTTDPVGRERMISLGAALHLACVAMRAAGHEPVVSALPQVDGHLVARLEEGATHLVTGDDRALLAAVPLRRTDRGPLDAASLPPSLPFLLQCAASEQGATLRLVTTRGDRATLADLVARADRQQAVRGHAEQEMALWLCDAEGLRADGVRPESSRGPAASFAAEFVQRDFSQAGSLAAHDRQGPDRALVGVLWTLGDTALDWISAGRALAAVLLRAATFGANASYLNQPLEERALRVHLNDQMGLRGFGQLVLRLGLGGAVAPAPRRAGPDLITHRLSH